MKRFSPIDLLAVVALGLGGCHKDASPAPAAPSASAKPIVDCSAEYPNLPLAELPPPARSEFCRFAKDTFCYCGCPHSVGQCLKDHPPCAHATRMTALALAEMAVGATAEKAGEVVAAYYESFKPDARVKFDMAKLPCEGSADAKLTLVEFSDFDCPHCKMARPILQALVKERSDVRLCFMSYPLHPHSSIAAAAAAYAAAKGNFWKMHDLLFENQEARATLNEQAYADAVLKLGAQAGLDRDGLDKAIHDPAIMQAFEETKAQGRKLGVDGTPFLFLNGRPLPAGPSPDMLKLTIGDELEWIAHGNAWAKD